MIIGTAGHIDHGKTQLIRVITGIDTDRLKEEKERGISIELGYAHYTLDNERTISFIDVPGHEKFIHNMLSGVTGIDCFLLVVAADDGVMPQTLEHLQILNLLNIQFGFCAITKVDLVSEDRVLHVSHQISELFFKLYKKDFPKFPISSITKTGLHEIQQHIVHLDKNFVQKKNKGYFRMPVDRVFTLSGIGVVVTGTVYSGSISIGQNLLISKNNSKVKIRNIHIQNKTSQVANSGERCAINISNIQKEDVLRGDWIFEPEISHTTDRIDAFLSISTSEKKAFAHNTLVHIHFGTSDKIARILLYQTDLIQIGESGFVQIIFTEKIQIFKGDRFIIRDNSANRTIGGGIVVHPMAIPKKKKDTKYVEFLQWMYEFELSEFIVQLRTSKYPELSRLDNLSIIWNQKSEEILAELQSNQFIFITIDKKKYILACEVWQELVQTCITALTEYHNTNPDLTGIDQELLRKTYLSSIHRTHFLGIVQNLIEKNIVHRKGRYIHLPDHRVQLNEEENQIYKSSISLLEEELFSPPRVRDISKILRIDESQVRKTFLKLEANEILHQIAKDHFYTHFAVQKLKDILIEMDGFESIRASEFRDKVQTGRKIAVQILEYFDAIGFTRRVGNFHRVA